MTTNNHPITPPPELVRQWMERTEYDEHTWFYESYIAEQAARWGADQELEACCEWTYRQFKLGLQWSKDLRAARRPKPPSLKEQAKFAAAVLRSPDETCSIAELQQHWHTICCALEQLDD
jgi:hypothetical protein